MKIGPFALALLLAASVLVRLLPRRENGPTLTVALAAKLPPVSSTVLPALPLVGWRWMLGP